MFELHITCTKDIDRIQIDLADGTTCVSESKTPKKSKEKTSNFHDNIEHYDDTVTSRGVIEKPEVPSEPKEPNVAEYLNGLEF